ncbi:MAG: hypothetical protein V1736_07450 [Pseudomonadota bacterium]
MDLNGRHLCPLCVETGQEKKTLKCLDNYRVLYDRVALALAVAPLLVFWLTVLTAPMALYVTVRYWKAAPSILRGSKVRFVIAAVFSLIEIGGWATLLLLCL